MDKQTKLRFELLAAWSGVFFVVLYPIFWAWIGRAQPPLSFAITAAEAAQFYLSQKDQIVLGMAVAAIVGGLWIPWTGQLTVVLWRIEGDAPVFTVTQLIGGVLTAFALVFCPIAWLMPAFRSDGDPQVIRAFSDYAYLTFNGTFIISTMQAVAAGMVGLADKREEAVFPRWVCWLAISSGLSFFVVAATPFVHTGPLALEGWFAGWIPGSMFFLWCATSTVYMIKDAGRRRRELVQD